MNIKLYDELTFERYNAKYNRIWEQLTNIGIFMLATFSAYIIALGGIEKGINANITFEQINRLLLLIALITAVCCGILITHLIDARKEIGSILQSEDL